MVAYNKIGPCEHSRHRNSKRLVTEGKITSEKNSWKQEGRPYMSAYTVYGNASYTVANLGSRIA